MTPAFTKRQDQGVAAFGVQVRVQGPGGIPNDAGLVAERSASWQPPPPIGLGANNGHVLGQVTGERQGCVTGKPTAAKTCEGSAPGRACDTQLMPGNEIWVEECLHVTFSLL